MGTLSQFSVAAFSVGALLTVSAQASSAGTVSASAGHMAVVDYRELDLSKQDGAQVLYQRIKRAARSVCQVKMLKSVERQRWARDCYQRVVAQTVSQLNELQLTGLHDTAAARRMRKRG